MKRQSNHFGKKRKLTPATNARFEEWSRMAVDESIVDPALYKKYDVKRGLRDISGKGVLAGLTRIGDVIAYAPDGTPAPGQLIYRGIDIFDLVDGFTNDQHFGFEETCYLLLFGELPSAKDLRVFQKQIGEFRLLPKRFVDDAILKMPSRDIMNAMSRGILALYTLDENPEDISIKNVLLQSMRLIAAFPLLAVYSYRAYLHHFKRGSLVIHHPVPELSTAENILHMLRPDSQYSDLEARLLDLALVLHAEHGGGNNSSFTTHVVSSSGTDTYGTIAAAMGSLKGPRHGGANIKAVQMFDDMKKEIRRWDSDKEVEAYLTKILTKKAFDHSGLVYGIGHAVYSLSDPRTIVLKKYAEKLAQEKGMEAEFDLHARVERIAPEVIGRVRKIYKGVSANVDFYSGFVYSMLGIPPELFTPLFAIARIAGWSAHRIEELANGGKIIRPAYKSVCARRDYVPLKKRKA